MESRVELGNRQSVGEGEGVDLTPVRREHQAVVDEVE